MRTLAKMGWCQERSEQTIGPLVPQLPTDTKEATALSPPVLLADMAANEKPKGWQHSPSAADMHPWPSPGQIFKKGGKAFLASSYRIFPTSSNKHLQRSVRRYNAILPKFTMTKKLTCEPFNQTMKNRFNLGGMGMVEHKFKEAHQHCVRSLSLKPLDTSCCQVPVPLLRHSLSPNVERSRFSVKAVKV